MLFFKDIKNFFIDLYNFPTYVKRLIKEHEYYKKEYLNLLSEYGRLQDNFNILLINHKRIISDIT